MPYSQVSALPRGSERRQRASCSDADLSLENSLNQRADKSTLITIADNGEIRTAKSHIVATHTQRAA